MKNAGSNTREKPVHFTIAIMAVVVVFIVLSVVFLINVLDDLNGKVRAMVYDLAYQKSTYVNQAAENNMETVRLAAVGLSDYKSHDKDTLRQMLQSMADSSQLDNLIIIDENGNAVAANKIEMNVASRTYFNTAMDGQANLSASIYAQPEGDYVNIYAVPVYGEDDRVIGVAAGVVKGNKFAGELDMQTDSHTGIGEQKGYLIDSRGKVLIGHDYGSDDELIDSFFFESTFMNGVSDEKKNKLISDFSKIDCSGVVTSKIGSEGYTAYYTDLKCNPDFHYVLLIPDNVIYDSVYRYIDQVTWIFILFLIVLAVVACAHALIVRANFKVLKSANDEISRMAYVDSITGYSTWAKFQIDAERLLSMEYRKYALVSFDIDKFKAINDMFGHEEGNRILKMIAETVKRNIKDSEAFARVNSDNFYILMHYNGDIELSARIENIIHAIEYEITDFVPVISFGVYRVTDKKMPLRKMGDLADMAKRTVKYGDVSTIAYYSEVMMKELREEKFIENEMQSALDTHEFVIYMQPKVALAGKPMLKGAEALVRWVKAEDIVPPGKFIPLFERNRFIVKLDFYIMDRVCKQIKAWERMGYTDVVVSVNMSRVHLDDPQFVERLFNICQKHEVTTSRLEIEITESAAYESMEQLTRVFKQLKSYGFHISIDDFGSGYSSLNMLKDLPADVLKIDRAFLTETGLNKRAYDIIGYVILMARSLGMETICEGIETEEQAQLLRRLGCDMAQGFYFAKPMPCDKFTELLEKQKNNQPIK